MSDPRWPEISCWLAAELADLPDRRTAVLGDVLALAEAGHLDITVRPDLYEWQGPVTFPANLPAELVELLSGLLSGRSCLPRPDVPQRLPAESAQLILLSRLKPAGRRTAARNRFTRWPLPGLTEAGRAQRQRVLDLPARLADAHGEAVAVPWARMVLPDDEFLDWYRVHLTRCGPPGWLSWSGVRVGDPAGQEGVAGLFTALRNEIVVGRRKPAPGVRDYLSPRGEKPIPVGVPVTEQHPWPEDALASYLRARAAAGPDTASGLIDVQAAKALLERTRAAGDDNATLDAQERLVALSGLIPGADETAHAAELVSRREAAARVDPHRHGPRLGLTLALWAHLLVVAGRARQGKAVADRAVEVLEPHQTTLPLAFAYDAVAAASFRTGRYLAAEAALTAASGLLRSQAVDGDAADLDRYRQLLADTGLRIVVGAAIDAADENLATGIALSREGRHADAASRLSAAQEQFADLLNPKLAPDAVTRWHRALLCRMGRAHWRHALAAHAIGRADAATADGRRAIWCFDMAKLGLPAADRDVWAAEAMTVLADVAEMAVAGGDVTRGLRLIEDGITLAGTGEVTDRSVLRALGTLLHNKANTLTNALVRQDGQTPYSLPDVVAVVADVTDIRERLAGLDDLARWELANTYLLTAKIAALAGKHGVAVELYCRTGALQARLGPVAGPLGDQTVAVGAMLLALAPDEVAAARADGRWPSALR